MCLAIPGRVAETYEEDGMRMGRIDFNGITKKACLEHVPQVRVGDYVLVHVGFALAIVDETEARRIFAYLDSMQDLDELRTP